MVVIAGQTAGKNWMRLFKGNHGSPGGEID